ncbi:Uncharacterised protein [Chlamydia trachomatis]|nr:Uncharacterised protein [Chlamydia trachomatis]
MSIIRDRYTQIGKHDKEGEGIQAQAIKQKDNEYTSGH